MNFIESYFHPPIGAWHTARDEARPMSVRCCRTVFFAKSGISSSYHIAILWFYTSDPAYIASIQMPRTKTIATAQRSIAASEANSDTRERMGKVLGNDSGTQKTL